MKPICLIVALFFSSFLVAQTGSDSVYLSPFIRDSEYLTYLFTSVPESRAALFGLGVRYVYVRPNGSFNTSGTQFEIEFNLARLFTRKFILGVTYEIAPFQSRRTPEFSSEFLSDFNSSTLPIGYGIDSVRGYTIQNGINRKDGNNIGGNIYSTIGICFSPFPQKYGDFMLEIKRGNRLYPFFGTGADNLYKSTYTNVFLTLRKCYSVELMFKPFILFSSNSKIFLFEKKKNFYKTLVLSLYYERLTLKNSEFHTIQLSQLVDNNFIDKYSNINNFGAKIGFYLY